MTLKKKLIKIAAAILTTAAISALAYFGIDIPPEVMELISPAIGATLMAL